MNHLDQKDIEVNNEIKTFNINTMTSEEKNSLAYKDCVDFREPSFPQDEDFMNKYRGWRNIAQFPDDKYEAY
jgi:hypothetical protein